MSEQKNIYYDNDLKIETYQLLGVIQKFPNHFHDYYVIGFIEGGRRHLWCKDKEYDLSPGDMILFQPGDNHCCAPINDEVLDYRAVNISPETMKQIILDVTGSEQILSFKQNVIYGSDMAKTLGNLYRLITGMASKIEKEECFYLFMEQMIMEYGIMQNNSSREPNGEVKLLCDYMDSHLAENVSLDELSALIGYGKTYLLHLFTREIGVSPYRYLQNTRISQAKKMLEKGCSIAEVVDVTGFSDQSHFTNAFRDFIGVSPKQYQNIFEERSKEK